MKPSEEKNALRRSLLRQRQALSRREWRDRSDRLCHNLTQRVTYRRSQCVLAYFAHQQEPDLGKLWDTGSDKIWGFPRCVGKTLMWHQWQPDDRLFPNRWGILEPEPTAAILTVDRIDCLLAPSVALDHRGYRLGYGGGFYDRLFAQPLWQGVPTIGLTFDFALVERLPVDPWDYPLGEICTD